MKLDLSKFKKAEDNDKFTILAHPSGHKIKISKKDLSDDYKKQLDEMPIHKAMGGPMEPRSQSHFRGSKNSGVSAAQGAKASNMVPKAASKAYTEPQDQGPDVVLAALNKQAPPFGPLGTEEKQHYPPCINPSCKSFGKSHPNCRCYGGVPEGGHFAKGGEVEKEYYCDDNRMHRKSCEYYAEGGSVKGVNQSAMEVERPQNKTEKSWAGESKAGEHVRSSDIRPDSNAKAKLEHVKTLSEMKSMPKPKIQGFWGGGDTEPQPTPSPTPDSDSETDTSAMSTLQNSINNAFGGKGNYYKGGGIQKFSGTDDPSDSEVQPDLKSDDIDSGINADSNSAPMPTPPPQDLDKEIDAANQAAGPAPEDDSQANAPIQASADSMPQDQSAPQSNASPDQNDPYASNPQTMDPYQAYQQKAANANQLMHDEMNKFYADVDSGKIQPKTLHDLYNDKSTLGKIGMLFGLIVGGAGAGLTHTDNAALSQMNKEIQNDLAAQEKNQQNKRSLFTINGQNLMNLANAGKIGADTRQMNIAISKGMQNYGYYNELAKQAGDYSKPQQAQKAQMTLALMRTSMQQENASAFAQAAGANALGQMLRGGGNTAAMKTGLLGPEMQEYGQDIESKTIPGIGKATRPVPENIRSTVANQQLLEDKLKDFQDYVTKNVGTGDWRKWPIAKQKAQEASNIYSSVLSGPNSLGKIDNIEKQMNAKHPLSPFQYLMGAPGRVQEMRLSNAMQLKRNLGSVGISNDNVNRMSNSSAWGQNSQIQKPKQSSGQYQEGQTATGPNGQKITFHNGKWS